MSYRNNFTFGCAFRTDLTYRLKDNERLFEGVYWLSRVRNAHVLDFFPLRISFHRVDSRTGIPKGGMFAKRSAREFFLGLPRQIRYAVIKGAPRFYPDPPRNVILGIDADPDYGLKEVFAGVLLPSEHGPYEFEYPRKFVIYSSGDADMMEPVVPERDASPVVLLNEKLDETALPPQEEEPGTMVSLNDRGHGKRRKADGEK